MINLLVALASLCTATPDDGIIVLDFQSKGILDKSILSDLWRRTHEIASEALPGRFLDTLQTRKRIFDENILIPARCDDACFARIGTRLHARSLLLPSIEKVNDQLKISFVLVDSRSGARLGASEAWSDGRIGQALDASLKDVLATVSTSGSTSIPGKVWTAAGLLAVGTGAIIFLGLDSPESTTQQPNTDIPIDVILD